MNHNDFCRSMVGIGFGAVCLITMAVLLPWWVFALALVWLLVAVFTVSLCQGAALGDREARERLARWNRIED